MLLGMPDSINELPDDIEQLKAMLVAERNEKARLVSHNERLHRPTGGKVHGLTTAASIWVTAALGVLCGIAAWPILVVGVSLVLRLLVFSGQLKNVATSVWAPMTMSRRKPDPLRKR